VLSVAFSPDGNWFATAGFDNTVRMWPVEILGKKEDSGR
jgi:WD40 repeat protein